MKFLVLLLSLFIFFQSLLQTTIAQGAFDCGRLKIIENDVRTLGPWVVSVFQQRTPKSSYNFFAAGIIVGPFTILTVFPGAYARSSTTPSIENLFIIAGTNSTFPTLIDRHSVLRQINYISPYSGHSFTDNQDYHYVILHLKEGLNLNTPFIRKICIPPLGVPKAIRDASAAIYDTKVAGFIAENEVKKVGYGFYNLVIVDLKLNIKCDPLYQQFYKGRASHVFCGKVKDSSTCSTPGNSVFVEFGGKQFLAGIAALIPHSENQNCNKDGTHFLSDLYVHLPWITRNVKCSPNHFACGNTECIPLTKVCNFVRDCPNGEDEDQIFCTNISKKCNSQSKILCHLNGKCVRNKTMC